jgi:large subunit ribosomal protein L24e
MKRNPRKVKWTKAFRAGAGKEMTVDSTLEFEKRRHIPVRYNRELVGTTIKAMKRVAEIRARREKVEHKKRINAGRAKSAKGVVVVEEEKDEEMSDILDVDLVGELPVKEIVKNKAGKKVEQMLA